MTPTSLSNLLILSGSRRRSRSPSAFAQPGPPVTSAASRPDMFAAPPSSSRDSSSSAMSACSTSPAAPAISRFPRRAPAPLVTGVDIAPNLIAQAKARAADESLSITFDVGDAEQLPYESSSFDTVVTMFGAMFAARPERAAAELLRVTQSGGRIAMANWIPTGFIGQMLKTTVAYRSRRRRACRRRCCGGPRTPYASG